MDRAKRKGIYLFKPFGFEVRINPSWFFLAFLIAWSLAVGYFPYTHHGLTVLEYWLMGIAGAIGLFFSIIFHELSHSLVGRRYNLPITGIQLFIFGGIAEMHHEPANAKTEFLMALAGPVSSVFLGICFYLLAILGKSMHWPVGVNAVLSYLFYINIALAIFNLLPGFPLDGGRIFRSILWGWKKDFKWATRVASAWGQGMGWILIIYGIFLILRGGLISGIWLCLIGFFLKNAAQAAYQNFMLQEAFHGEKISKYTKTNLVTVTEDISLQDLVDHYFHKYYYKLYPVVSTHDLLGYISSEEIKTIPKDQWPNLRVKEVMKPCPPELLIDASSSVTKALRKMVEQKLGRLIVLDQGQLYGIISLSDIRHIMAFKMDFHS
ncbi:MAG: site-2 protease family protein [Proteobacteria bacterium]|nr:site-2 protease family protein [Pseudomonadota bacterium]